MAHVIHVRAAWDDEAGVWYTAETSIPGLATEAETLERLRERLLVIIPDLLEDEMPEAWLRIVAQARDVTPFQAAKKGGLQPRSRRGITRT